MFQKTVVVDNTGMNEWAKKRLGELSEKVISVSYTHLTLPTT